MSNRVHTVEESESINHEDIVGSIKRCRHLEKSDTRM